MLKKRIIGVLVVREGIVVQSVGFREYLPVGRPAIAVEYLNRWGIDEIVLLDISATRQGRAPDFRMIEAVAPESQVPLAVGGGIRSVEEIERIIHSGADKIVLNTAAACDPALISEGARRFGSQCVVVSIDARLKPGGGYEAVTTGLRPTGHDPFTLARMAEGQGAGEILINSVDRDGSKRGFDAALVRKVAAAVGIPVIAAGGAGHARDFAVPLANGADAAAAANFFHFTEHSVIMAKRFLKNRGETIRLDSYAAYEAAGFDEDARLDKQDDAVLEKLRFEYIPEEVI